MRRRKKKGGDDDEDVLVPAAVISLAAPAPELPEDPYAPQPGYYSSGNLLNQSNTCMRANMRNGIECQL